MKMLDNIKNMVRLSEKREDLFTDEGEPIIDWMIRPEWYGSVAEPYPASQNLPDWYKKVDATDDPKHLGGNNVGNCIPFFDALTTGWIIPCPVDIEVSYDEEGNMNFDWLSDVQFVDYHSRNTVTEHFPDEMKLAVQIYHKWAVAVPEGYSILMTEPFNRMETRWKAMTGIIDVDKYMGPVNGSLIWKDFEWEGIIEQGTPLFQVIPFKRDGLIRESRVRPMTEDDVLRREQTSNKVLNIRHYYRNHAWSNRKKSRNIPYEPEEEEESDESGSGCPFHR